jgi:phytoene dehydrogenase-like protein
MAEYDAIVIGSGAGGLSAALKLSRSGFSVLLLEAMTAYGGYLNTFHRKGYTFDTGLHLIGELARGGTFRRLLDELGLSEAVEFVELDPEGFDRYIFPDYELKLGKGKERLVEKLIRDFPKEERGIQKFFKVFDKIVKAGTDSGAGDGGILSMLLYILKHPVMIKYSRVPYQKLLDEVTSDKRLQAVLAANCAYYGVHPAKASVIIAILVWNHYFNGAFYPCGGSGSFKDAFLNGLQQYGAVLKNRSRVVAIEKQGKEFLVKTASEEQYSSRVVISNADPVPTLGSLVSPELVSPQIKRKIDGLKPSGGSFYAFVGTDLDLQSLGMTNANIHHFESYNINEIYENWFTPNPEKDVNGPYFFITSASLKDPDGGHAPADYHNIEIMTGANYEVFKDWANFPSMKRGEDYKSFKENIGGRLIAAAEHYIPDLTQHIDFVEYATPLTNEYWVNAVKGGNYGPIQTPEQIGSGRFMNFASGVNGLFLVGAGTIGGGVMVCVASGVLAGTKAAKYLEA